MQRLKIPFVIMLTLVLVLSSAMVASAAKPEHAGSKGRGKADVAMAVEVAETDPVTTEDPVEAGTEEGTTEEEGTGEEPAEEANPYDLSQMIEQIEAIRASLPGKGNAWGRIAKELGFEKAPGSIATLVEQLKQMAGHVEEEETVLPDITETVTVTVVSVEQDEEGNLTGSIVVAWPGAEAEEPATYTIEVDDELRAQLAAGTKLNLSIDDAGELVVALHVEQPEEATEGEPTDGTTTDDAATDDTTADDTTTDGDDTEGTTTEGTDTTDGTTV